MMFSEEERHLFCLLFILPKSTPIWLEQRDIPITYIYQESLILLMFICFFKIIFISTENTAKLVTIIIYHGYDGSQPSCYNNGM